MSKTIKIKTQPAAAFPYNAQNIGSREEQQDAFCFSDMLNREEAEKYGYIAVLADGMGGMENGALAASTTVREFMNTYLTVFDGDVKEAMLKAVETANREVQEIDGAGATLCAVVIKDWQLYYVSVGDSHIYFYRNGYIRRLNEEHNYLSVLNKLVSEGKMTKEEAESHPDRQSLTSYIGIDDLEEIDYNEEPIPLMCGDSILICSDGLYRAMSEEEMVYALKNGDEAVAESMVQTVLSKKIRGQDNITVLVVDID